MSKGMVSAAGGLSAADREKLIPENIREGVVLFSGTPREIVGTLTWQDLLPVPLDIFKVGQGLISIAEPIRRTSGSGPITVTTNAIVIGSPTRYEAYDSICFSNEMDLTKYVRLKIVAYTAAGTNRMYARSTAKGLIGSGYMQNGQTATYVFELGSVSEGKNMVSFGCGQNTADPITITSIIAEGY